MTEEIGGENSANDVGNGDCENINDVVTHLDFMIEHCCTNGHHVTRG